MSRSRCDAPIDFPTLAGYWLDELDEARAEEVEAHLLGCGECTAIAQGLADLSAGIRALVDRGAVRAVVTEPFVKRIAERGLQLREYTVSPGGSVNCTFAPDDDVLVTRLQAPLEGIGHLDVLVSDASGREQYRLRDVPFDAAAREVVFTSRSPDIRALPASTLLMRLIAVEGENERTLGDYTFHHRPWQGP